MCPARDTVRHTIHVSLTTAEPIALSVDASTRVSGLLLRPERADLCFVLAHGAGAGMSHPFMTAVAEDLAALGIATLRYQFPYMEHRCRRPDPPRVCQATVRAAVRLAQQLAPGLPILAGGKSFGGRMTSGAQAAAPLAGVVGLAFLGFPLHPPKRPEDKRGAHLFEVHIPMLFLQGTRDALAELELIEPLVTKLGSRATLKLLEAADHSFHVPARAGRTDAQVRSEMLGTLAAWSRRLISADRSDPRTG